MRTKEGLELTVERRWDDVWLALGRHGHLLGAETALRLGHALAEASAGPPASAFVRSVVTRHGQIVTVDREPVGTGVRVLVGRPPPDPRALPGAVRADPAEPEDVLDLSSADAGELALELLRTAAGLPHQLTFAAWTEGAWLSERRGRGDLEAAMVQAVRAAAPGRPADQRALWERIGVLLGNVVGTALSAAPEADEAELEIASLADELAEIGVPHTFVLGLGDALYRRPARRHPDWSAECIVVYDAGRQVCASIMMLAQRRGDR